MIPDRQAEHRKLACQLPQKQLLLRTHRQPCG